HTLVDYHFWPSQIQDQPRRWSGWVVQEWLLAPLVLHFSAHQLVWECRTVAAAEQYPNSLPGVLRGVQTAFKSLDTGRRWGGGMAAKDRCKYRSGCAVSRAPSLDEYCGGVYESLLTFANDNLVALSGITKLMQGKLGASSIKFSIKSSILRL
ncbi:hypothetical protein BJ878DRAFT_426798, partial [Calycina marina]